MVHLTGIEPAHREIMDPKSIASASSATGAYSSILSQIARAVKRKSRKNPRRRNA